MKQAKLAMHGYWGIMAAGKNGHRLAGPCVIIAAGVLAAFLSLFHPNDVHADNSATVQAEEAYQSGHTAYDKGDYSKAYQHFSKAARLQPEERYYLAWAGQLAKDMGPMKKRRAIFKNISRSLSGISHLTTLI